MQESVIIEKKLNQLRCFRFLTESQINISNSVFEEVKTLC